MNLPDISLAYGDTFFFMVGALVLFVALFVFYLSRLERRGKQGQIEGFGMRTIEAYNAAREGLSRAAETGRAVHTSPGTGSVGGGGSSTASTLAGLTLVETMARV